MGDLIRLAGVCPVRRALTTAALVLAAWAGLPSRGFGAEPKAVAVGAGSYAEFPPPRIGARGDQDSIDDFLSKNLFIDDSQAGKPVPTNQWWTHLLVHGFGGSLWAHPLVVQAKPGGCDVYYPARWNANGGDMMLESPLEIRGEASGPAPANARADLVLADFEGEHYPDGWKTAGTAFGSGPAKGAFDRQSPVSGFVGKGLVNTALPNDGAKGTLTSLPFTVQRRYIHFLIGGGRRPDQLRCKLLTDSERTVARTATGNNSNRLQWQTWDVGDLLGQPAVVQLEDNATDGWGHLLVDEIVASESPQPPTGDAPGNPNLFVAAEPRVLRWGDWTLTFRLRAGQTQRLDVTLGHGLPFVWLEYQGLSPLLHVGAEAICTGEGDTMTVEMGGRCYGLYAPEGGVFQRDGENLRLRFAPKGAATGGFLVVAALPARGFREYAFAVPRNSRLSWEYDPLKGEVRTHWHLDTEPLQGSGRATLQGWAPHHYREGMLRMLLDGAQYATARGLVKCAAGNEFEVDYPFKGLLPDMPCPQVLGKGTPNDFDPARLRGYLSEFSKKDKSGNDTYWGGKKVLCMARYLVMAIDSQNGEDVVALRDKSRRALVDWFTYTPGEKAHFFARYPRWKALVGFSTSYGSAHFNDHHFHYGYFTTAAALLGMHDAAFLKDYGPMARLVAKEYANWDRADAEFPFLRTLDAWEGHSWAGGIGSGGGNNQESSSEAVQGWGGVFLLGAALGDDAMTAAGAMGYTMETAAAREYWFDYHAHKEGPAAATFSPSYEHRMTGILGGAGRAFATYFSGDPAWIYGIQWLPASPFMNYLGQDREFAQWQLKSMWDERTKHLERENAKRAGKGKSPETNALDTMGALGTVILGFAAQADPDWAAARMDELYASHSAAMTTDDMRAVVYYLAHANRALGPQRADAHTSVPTSGVFCEPRTGVWTAVIFNPKPTAVTATVFRAGQPIFSTISVPAGALVTTTLRVP